MKPLKSPVEYHTRQNNYTFEKKLGDGRFSETILVRDQNGKQYVIKLLKMTQIERWKTVERLQREIDILKQLNHPAIPKYIDTIDDEAMPGIVQEYCPGKTVAEMIQNGESVTQDQLDLLLHQGLAILSYLSTFDPPLIHRDISPNNLIIDENDQLYLIDFGGVQNSFAEDSDTVTTIGTFGYMAPEQIRGMATPKSDCYALGMSLLALINGKEIDDTDLDDHYGLPNIEKLLQIIPEAQRPFYKKLIAFHPDNRFETPSKALHILKTGAEQIDFEITPEKTDIYFKGKHDPGRKPLIYITLSIVLLILSDIIFKIEYSDKFMMECSLFLILTIIYQIFQLLPENLDKILSISRDQLSISTKRLVEIDVTLTSPDSYAISRLDRSLFLIKDEKAKKLLKADSEQQAKALKKLIEDGLKRHQEREID